MPTPLPDDLAELISGQFRLLAEPMRLRLLERLRAGERSVGDLAEELGASQQNVSKHLQTLFGAGAVARRKQGNSVLYRIEDPELMAMCDQVCSSVERRFGRVAEVLSSIDPA
ncbi:MAG: metalloregulator ArsR/SmtB family transcription factor [Solirubrobacterales bacterium]|nr:metalloregulator ArsR/SmtB family transcription factor [Solirubrobacterales bacterium]